MENIAITDDNLERSAKRDTNNSFYDTQSDMLENSVIHFMPTSKHRRLFDDIHFKMDDHINFPQKLLTERNEKEERVIESASVKTSKSIENKRWHTLHRNPIPYFEPDKINLKVDHSKNRRLTKFDSNSRELI